MRTALALAFVVAAGLGFGYAIHPAPAKADKTVTYLSAGVQWDSYSVWPDGTSGAIRAEICAHALTADGGVGPTLCEQTNVGAASAIAVDSVALATGKGVPFWKTRQGL